MHRLADRPSTASTTSTSGTTLCHLLPALRWGDPRRLGAVLDHPRLPPQWWSSTPLNDVTATVEADEIARRAVVALCADWPHLTVDLAMPALRFCVEGQRTDRGQSIGQVARTAAGSGGDDALAVLVQALLRPFLEGGRDLAAADPGGVLGAVEEEFAELAAALVRRLPAGAPAAVRAAAESVAAWARQAQPAAAAHGPVAHVPAPQAAADRQPRREIAQTRRCFQTGQGMWCYRIDVTQDHLRGSGFPVPIGFAAHLDLTPGSRTELVHEAGTVTVTWGGQPRFGSLRSLLKKLRAVEGDHVFLAVREGHLKALRIAGEAEDDTSDIRQALRLMALSGSVSEEKMAAVMGQRVGLADARTMDEVYAHLQLRGDKDILALLLKDAAAHPAGASAEQRPTEGGVDGPGTVAAGAQRDPAWDADVIPLLDPDTEADLLALATAVAARGKTAPVFGLELGEAGWQADFAWQHDDVMIAVFRTAQTGSHPSAEDEQRDAAFSAEGWRTGSASEWLQRLDELMAALPDTGPSR